MALLRRDGVQRALITPRSRIHSFNWMQRGRAVYLVLDRDPSSYTLARDGALGPAGGATCTSSPDPAPDGTYLECGDTLVYVVLPPGRSEPVAPDLDDEVIDPALSPSGKGVVFVRISHAAESTLWMFDIPTGRSRNIVPVMLSPYLPYIKTPVWSRRQTDRILGFFRGRQGVGVPRQRGRRATQASRRRRCSTRLVARREGDRLRSQPRRAAPDLHCEHGRNQRASVEPWRSRFMGTAMAAGSLMPTGSRATIPSQFCSTNEGRALRSGATPSPPGCYETGRRCVALGFPGVTRGTPLARGQLCCLP